jgi:hypothetical protein
MRKSTVIILVILLVAGIGMLFILDVATEMTRETLQAQQRLTRLFGDRGDIVHGSHVRLRWENQEQGRTGQGLKVEVTPAKAVLERSGGLRGLVRALAREAPATFGRVGESLRWMRILVFFPDGERLETWLERDLEDAFGDPNPPLPETWPETKKPPAPPPTPAPGPAPAPTPDPEKPR